MKRTKTLIFIFIIMLCILKHDAGNASIAQDGVQYKDGLLSVNIRNASLKEFLKIISEKTGVEIYVFGAKEGSITANFTGKSLEKGLSSILRDCNFAIVFSENKLGSGVHWYEPLSMGSSGHSRAAGIKGASGAPSSSGTKRTAKVSGTESGPVINKGPALSGTDSSKQGIKDGEQEEASEYYLGNNIASGYRNASNGDDGNEDNGDKEGNDEYPYDDNDDESSSDANQTEESIADYEENEDNADVESDGEEGSFAEEEDLPSWYYEGMSREETKLRYRIDTLEKQIESGYADRQYDLWSSIKSEDYLTHTSYWLEIYQERLDNLTAN
ncbi:MAG: hypothetical protein JW944_02025 [Deltaproteobacteria bacterium]|nr:hypothetical protein [Deltaproteobacteria bacterium]